MNVKKRTKIDTTQQYTRWKFQRRWTFSLLIVSRPQSKRHFLTMISSEVPSQWYRKGFSYDSSFQQHTTQPADHSRTFSPASHFLFWIAVYKIAAPIHNIPERTLTLFSSFPYTNTKPLSFSLCFRRWLWFMCMCVSMCMCMCVCIYVCMCMCVWVGG